MADARAAIFGKVRRSLGVSGEEAPRRAAVAARLKAHARNLVPARGQGDAAHRLVLFRRMLEQVGATVAEAAAPSEVPGAVADYLRRQNLPARLRRGADPLLAKLPWREQAPALEIGEGRADPADAVSLSHAFGGVAETGTLVLTSGADNPTTLNFLPDHHIVVVEADHIAASYEDVWDRLRQTHGEGAMPRAVNLISGPSRTGDIEQTLIMGAHGPRSLHVIVLSAVAPEKGNPRP